MRHPQTKKIVTRAAACGVALGCLLATAAPAADRDGALKASAPNNNSVVRLPKCKKAGGHIVVDLSTGTTNGVTNANGTLDPKWQLNGAPTGTGFTFPPPLPVYSMAPCCGAWASPVPPATWVSPWQSGNFGLDAVGGIYKYEVAFYVPSSYYNIQVQGVCRADDEGIVSLTHAQAQTQTMAMPYCHFQPGAQIGTFSFMGQTGLSHLRVRVQNGPPHAHTQGDPTGLMVQATLTADCKR